MRRRDDTLHDSLLALAQEIVAEDGPEALNIRALAKRAGVAVGTVYNYFGSKDDILLALTEAYWRATLAEMREVLPDGPLVDQVAAVYQFLRARIDDSAGMLMGSLGNVEAAGRARMASMQQVLRDALVRRIRQDPGIRPGVWRENFTQAQYADFILMNLLLLLRTEAADIAFFLEIMRKTLY